jgi:hypothetical protein
MSFSLVSKKEIKKNKLKFNICLNLSKNTSTINTYLNTKTHFVGVRYFQILDNVFSKILNYIFAKEVKNNIS